MSERYPPALTPEEAALELSFFTGKQSEPLRALEYLQAAQDQLFTLVDYVITGTGKHEPGIGLAIDESFVAIGRSFIAALQTEQDTEERIVYASGLIHNATLQLKNFVGRYVPTHQIAELSVDTLTIALRKGLTKTEPAERDQYLQQEMEGLCRDYIALVLPSHQIPF